MGEALEVPGLMGRGSEEGVCLVVRYMRVCWQLQQSLVASRKIVLSYTCCC